MLKLLTLAILLPCAAFSQTTLPPSSGATYYVGNPAAFRDSVNALPLVRKEALKLRAAAGRYRVIADSAQAAYFWQSRSLAGVQVALREEKLRTAQEHERANDWKGKARRRGFLNWLTVAVVVVVTGLAVR